MRRKNVCKDLLEAYAVIVESLDGFMGEYLRGKTVLVTGGTGSIGKALVKQILNFEPDSIRVLSRDEYSQYCFRRELENNVKVRFLLKTFVIKSV